MEEFTRQRGLKAEKTLEPALLAQLYQEQFQHIRHIDRKDTITFIFIVTATLALFAGGHLPVVPKGGYHRLAIAIVQFLLLAGGIHMASSNAQSRWVRFAVVGQIEKALGLATSGVIPSTLTRDLPASFTSFVSRLLLSYRGPMIVVYAGLAWASAFYLFSGTTQAPVANALAIALTAALAVASFYVNYAALARHLAALKQEIELGRVPGKSLAEQYCDLAEALLRLRPPRLNDALAHYQKALELEPENARAKEGVEKMMSWRVSDYR